MSTISILATGDEVIEGEILNSNAQLISQKLTDIGYYVGQHLACRDDLETIKTCMSFLLERHDILIITGGLGPTVDDITRFAVSSFIDVPLEFYLPTWQWLENRYKKLNRPIPETNKQQAMFPKGAYILSNEKGSADGCLIKFNQKIIILLPGPPSECLPLIDKDVLPYLNNNCPAYYPPILKWRVFGISESKLAEMFKENFPAIDKEIGYRWHYPYIDVKYRNKDVTIANKVKQQLNVFLNEFIICGVDTSASNELKNKIQNTKKVIWIDDQVTGGVLQKALLSPQTFNQLTFSNTNGSDVDLQIIIKGIEPYWRGIKSDLPLVIDLECIESNNKSSVKLTLPNQPLHMLPYVTELVSSQINLILG